ncbi:hypothetical protein KW783_03275 [Candidatus Parcubacteria bacterium]|nr:hypothetical protein [Candidatus Parcubacteria bacterium]
MTLILDNKIFKRIQKITDPVLVKTRRNEAENVFMIFSHSRECENDACKLT